MELRQIQTQTLSQLQLQSISLLQMSTLELESYILELSLENPVIDLREDNYSHETGEVLLQKAIWLEENDRQDRYYSRSDEEDMDEAYKIAPEWTLTLKRDGIKTMVIFPLRSDNKTIGYIWAGNFDPKKTMQIKETLSLTAFILSAEIANEQNVRKMKIMSSTDLLTGVLNRNSMNNRISEDISGIKTIAKPFGIFFIDVNGLKTINDTKGHLAGDNLLKEVASMLQKLQQKKNQASLMMRQYSTPSESAQRR